MDRLMAKDGVLGCWKGLSGLVFSEVATPGPFGLGIVVCLCTAMVGIADAGSGHAPAAAQTPTAFFVLHPVDPPVGMGPPLRNFTVDANEIILPSGGVRLWFEIQLGGWAPDLLQTWQATIASASYSNGVGADLHPAVEPCGDSNDCASLFGRRSACAAGFCVPGWQDTLRGDFVIQGGISAVRTTTLEFTYGSTVAPSSDPAVDNGEDYYGGTLVVDVPQDAAGTYELRFRNDGASFQVNAGGAYIPFTVSTMRITLRSACCMPDATCAEGLVDCVGSGGVRVASCRGDCDGNRLDDRCELLQGASDCNRNATLDACDVPWDADGDGAVTRADYGLLYHCIDLPCESLPCGPGFVAGDVDPCCGLSDVDNDGDVDLRDFAELEILLGMPAP